MVEINGSKQNFSFILRPMCADDIDAGMQLKALNNWNQVREDWDLLLNYPLASNWVAESKGQVIGTVSMVIYPPGIGWIGMMLVRPNLQGQGIGRKLMERVLDHSESVSTFCLDATDMGKHLYDKLGFMSVGTVNRFISEHLVPLDSRSEKEIIPLTSEYLQLVVDYDHKRVGMDRKFLLEYLYGQSPEHAFVYIVNDEIKGYCLGRPGSQYLQIGPLVANHEEIAKKLFLRVSQELTDQPVVIDLTDQSMTLTGYLMESGFNFQRSLTRMYMGNTLVQKPISHIYVSAGPELG